MAKKGNIQLPVDSSQVLSFVISAIPVIAIGGYLYAEFENKIDNLERTMEDADIKIEELMAKHIVDEEQRYEDMEEQVKWYQKEMGFNLNPFSRRKNGKK